MTSEPVKCNICPDDFCYVCGAYSLVQGKKRIVKAHKNAYLSYFGFDMCNQNKYWVPHSICKDCHLGLLKWMNDCGDGLNFVQPMCWREPKDHSVDCYFCLTQIDTITGHVEYANVISITRPIANTMPAYKQHLDNIVPVMKINDRPHLILPNELDMLISGLDLSERSAEILVKAFQEWKILAPCK